MLESKVENYLQDKSSKYGFLCYKFTSPGTSGVPDRILIGHGKVIFVETKAPGKTARKLQEYIIKQMRKHGAIVYVADTIPKIDNIFEEIKTTTKEA